MFFRWFLDWSPRVLFVQWRARLLSGIARMSLWLFGNPRRISTQEDFEMGRVSPDKPEFSIYEDSTAGSDYVHPSKGEFLASGASGMVERLPSGNVVKTPWPNSEDCLRDMRTENRIYQTLGQHPRLVPLIDWDPMTCVLTLEYMPNGNLKDFIVANSENITTKQRLQWALEAAEGLEYLHRHWVIHCDIEPKNFFLDANLEVRIADFAGSSLRGARPTVCGAWRFVPPDFDWRRGPMARDDFFGFGSTMYFIMTGRYPFQELDSDEVPKKYKANEFPDLTDIEYGGDVINRCWHSGFASAQKIREAIQELVRL